MKRPRAHALMAAVGTATAGALLAVGVAVSMSALDVPSTTTQADTGWNVVPAIPVTGDPVPVVDLLNDTGWN